MEFVSVSCIRYYKIIMIYFNLELFGLVNLGMVKRICFIKVFVNLFKIFNL